MDSKPLYVTKPAMPPLSDFIPYLEKIWENQILTNAGPMHEDLERKLCEHLRVPYISLCNNATIALMIACKALDLKGEVITTPFTFVATSQALLWNQLKPIFVDIENEGFNIDPNLIEAAINENTSAILPVHCYGYPCQIQAIESIAKKHKLKVIYDAAHAFGVKDEQGSILNAGDLSILSFHATKVFNTFEGGAIVSHSLEMKQKIDLLKNFGICGDQDISLSGLNGKMSEVNAAFGLLQLDYISTLLEKRKRISDIYFENLTHLQGIQCFKSDNFDANYAYFPILIHDNFPITRDDVYNKLMDEQIFARRYFYPLLPSLSVFNESTENLKNALNKVGKIICLPLYPDLTEEEQMRVINFFQNVQGSQIK